MSVRHHAQIAALPGGAWIAEALEDLDARTASVQALARSLTTPFPPMGVLVTDGAGAPSLSRLPWTAVPYSGSRFSASAGTWTVGLDDQRVFRLLAFGPWLCLHIALVGTSTSAGMGTTLYVHLPDGWRGLWPTTFCGAFVWRIHSGPSQGSGLGQVFVRAAPNNDALALTIDPLGATSWASSVGDLLEVQIQVWVPAYHPTFRPLQSGEFVTS